MPYLIFTIIFFEPLLTLLYFIASIFRERLIALYSFFLCPQFTESATEREVCAVDSENSNNLQNDSWRIIQLERHFF